MKINFVLSLAILFTVVSASDPGSLEKLLQRIAQRDGHAQIEEAEKVHHHGTGIDHTHVGPRPFKPKSNDSTVVVALADAAGTGHLPVVTGATARIIRLVKKATEAAAGDVDIEKRFTPVHQNQPDGENPFAADTPKVTLIPPSFPPLARPTEAVHSSELVAESLPSDIKVIPAASSAIGAAQRSKPTNGAHSSKTFRHIHYHSSAVPPVQVAQDGREPLAPAAAAPTEAVQDKKDYNPAFDLLRRLQLEKRALERVAAKE